MVEMYSNILMNMMNAFTSIISNNLNMVMKMLAAPYDYFGSAHNHIQPVGNECGVAIPG